MRVQTFDGTPERRVLIGMVTNSNFLRRLLPKWEDGAFSASPANVVAGWCVDHYKNYDKAPGKDIQGRFEAWSETCRSNALRQQVEELVASLSDEYQQNGKLSSRYLLDLAGSHFNRVKVEKAIDKARGFLDAGQTDRAMSTLTTVNKVELGVGAGVDLFLDRAAVGSVFAQETSEDLVGYRGGMGRFFYGQLCRGKFVAFLGSEKAGKTSFLVDLAYRAMINRKRVAFFEVGDEVEEDIYERFLVRASGRPSYSPDGKWPYRVDIPTSITKPKLPAGPDGKDQHPPADVTWTSKTFKRPIDEPVSWAACERVMRTKVKSRRSFLKICVYPSGGISANGIGTVLQGMTDSGWVPDVVVCDYADLLEPVDKRADRRHREDDTWRALRGLSQKLHCLMVTATQATRESYDRKILDRRHVSEDKRKLAHATLIVGINVTIDEKEKQVARLNQIVKRKGGYSPRHCCYTAGCLALANPCAISVF